MSERTQPSRRPISGPVDKSPRMTNTPEVRREEFGREFKGPLAELASLALGPTASALTYSPEAEAALLRLFSGLTTKDKVTKPFYASTHEAYPAKRAAQMAEAAQRLGKEASPTVHPFNIDDSRLIEFGKTYDLPELPYSNLKGSMLGDDIYQILADLPLVHQDDIVRRAGFAGFERPNTGDFGKGRWFRVSKPEEAMPEKFAKGGPVNTPKDFKIRTPEEKRTAARRALSVMNSQEPSYELPDPRDPRTYALEAPMISPDDLIGSGIPTKLAGLLSKAAPVMGGLGVIKNKGGNWLSGSVEGALRPLQRRGHNGEAPITGSKSDMLNNWIDKQLTRYIKNEMATPEDPIRALAERGVLHFEAKPLRRAGAIAARQKAGTRQAGESYLASAWEDLSDIAISPRAAGEQLRAEYPYNAETMPWLSKLAPDELVYRAERETTNELGFPHLIDELRNSLNPESGLPRELLLDPASLPRVSVPQAVERVAKINAWRAAQKAEADALKANNAATVLFKEYPENNPMGLRWVELRGEDVAKDSGPMPLELDNKNMGPEAWQSRGVPPESFRKAYDMWLQGQEGVGPDISLSEAIWKTDPEWVSKEFKLGSPAAKARQALQDALKYEGDTMGHCVGGYCDDVLSGRSRIYSLRDAKGQPHVTIETAPEDEAARIVQIKGKANRAPNEEYLPFVQDFVKSGKWSDVGDIENAGMVIGADGSYIVKDSALETLMRERGLTAEEAREFLDNVGDEGYANGGLVTDDSLNDDIVQNLLQIAAEKYQQFIPR